jgi:hypothetical protein
MTKTTLLAAGAALMAAGTVMGQDIPDPNPVPNADGTYTWYVGNNTQYPVIQSVLTGQNGAPGCTDGDEIVVMEGQYVESLSINRKDVTIRCATAVGASSANGSWQSVTFWNPTEGFENNNGHAMKAGDNTGNTYIGRPREITQLATGHQTPTQVPVGGAGEQEWVASQTMVDICRTDYTSAYGENGHMVVDQTRMQAGLDADGNLAMTFWSRSIDDVAVLTEDGANATFSYCDISSQNGFGGGIACLGADNNSAFVNCTIHDTFSGGQAPDGFPVHAITIIDGRPLFSGCDIYSNLGNAEGVVYQEGGMAHYMGCNLGLGAGQGNMTPVSDGVMYLTGGAYGTFTDCTMQNNVARFGTVYFDSSENADNDYVLMSNCAFRDNNTVDDQYGAVIHCTDAAAGRDPLCVFDRCEWDNLGTNGAGTQQGFTNFEKNVRSNYFPYYRILRDLSTGTLDATTDGAGVDSANDGSTGANPADINGDGAVDGADLAALLGAWG